MLCLGYTGYHLNTELPAECLLTHQSSNPQPEVWTKPGMLAMSDLAASAANLVTGLTNTGIYCQAPGTGNGNGKLE